MASHARGIRAAQLGLVANAALAAVKLVAGIVGNAYALVADAIESMADVVGSLIVWRGLAVAALPADEDHPFGHGKAEAIAAAAVSVLLLGAAVGVAWEAIREIRTPHHLPASWTLGVLVAVMIAKWVLARRIAAVGADIGSTAVRADAWHHLSDAITSAAAFVGIALALVGHRMTGSTRWAAADDWAALVAAAVIAFNGWRLLLPALHDLMDRMPSDDVVSPVRRAADTVPGVLGTEKLHIRKVGLGYRVIIHVLADGSMTLDEGHALAHRVQDAICQSVPRVQTVLVHMEPFAPHRKGARREQPVHTKDGP